MMNGLDTLLALIALAIIGTAIVVIVFANISN